MDVVAQLALFLAARPLLDPETVVAVLKMIPEPCRGLPGGEVGEEAPGVEGKGKELERREIIEEFLEFSRRFPKQFKGEMMDSYFEWKEDL